MMKDGGRSGGVTPGRGSRRAFLASGAVGGAWWALGAPLGLLAVPTARGEDPGSGPPIGRLMLELDGKPAALLKLAAGGNTALGLADPVTNDPRAATLTVDELYLEAMLLSGSFIDWIRGSLAGKAPPRTVNVVAYTSSSGETNFREIHRHALTGARLTEISLPSISRGGSVDPVAWGFRVAADLASARWSSSATEVTLASLSKNPPRNIDSVVWVQGLEAPAGMASSVAWGGLLRRPDGQWTAAPVVLTMPAVQANPFEEWMDQVLRRQAGDRPGGIRLYDHSRTSVMAGIEFPALGISSIKLQPRKRWEALAEANVELYCRGGAKFSLNGLTM